MSDLHPIVEEVYIALEEMLQQDLNRNRNFSNIDELITLMQWYEFEIAENPEDIDKNLNFIKRTPNGIKWITIAEQVFDDEDDLAHEFNENILYVSAISISK